MTRDDHGFTRAPKPKNCTAPTGAADWHMVEGESRPEICVRQTEKASDETIHLGQTAA